MADAPGDEPDDGTSEGLEKITATLAELGVAAENVLNVAKGLREQLNAASLAEYNAAATRLIGIYDGIVQSVVALKEAEAALNAQRKTADPPAAPGATDGTAPAAAAVGAIVPEPLSPPANASEQPVAEDDALKRLQQLAEERMRLRELETEHLRQQHDLQLAENQRYLDALNRQTQSMHRVKAAHAHPPAGSQTMGGGPAPGNYGGDAEPEYDDAANAARLYQNRERIRKIQRVAAVAKQNPGATGPGIPEDPSRRAVLARRRATATAKRQGKRDSYLRDTSDRAAAFKPKNKTKGSVPAQRPPKGGKAGKQKPAKPALPNQAPLAGTKVNGDLSRPAVLARRKAAATAKRQGKRDNYLRDKSDRAAAYRSKKKTKGSAPVQRPAKGSKPGKQKAAKPALPIKVPLAGVKVNEVNPQQVPGVGTPNATGNRSANSDTNPATLPNPRNPADIPDKRTPNNEVNPQQIPDVGTPNATGNRSVNSDTNPATLPNPRNPAHVPDKQTPNVDVLDGMPNDVDPENVRLDNRPRMKNPLRITGDTASAAGSDGDDGLAGALSNQSQATMQLANSAGQGMQSAVNVMNQATQQIQEMNQQIQNLKNQLDRLGTDSRGRASA